MPARGESVVVHARGYEAINVPESSAAPLCPGSPRHGSVSAHRATARGHRCLGVDRGTLRGGRCVSHRLEACRCVGDGRAPRWRRAGSRRQHEHIARSRTRRRTPGPPWQASCRRRACGSREIGSRVAANLEVRPGGERRMGSSGANGFIRQDKVLPETLLNASSPKHDCSGSGSSRCSAVFCLDPAIDRQADRAEDRP
jgi:hypothetical protein